MKTILHIVNKSSFEKNSLNSCLRTMSESDALLFIENGVYNALKNATNQQTLKNLKNRIWALLPDLLARGYGQRDVIDYVELVDYEGFVDLTVEHDLTKSWL